MLALTGPAVKAMKAGTTPTLTWIPSKDVTGHRVQVDNAGTFTGELVINVLASMTQ